MAEDRCNTLKDQLDYMKQVYGVKKTGTVSRKFSIHPNKEQTEIMAAISNCSMSSCEARSNFPRQNSNAIGTDTSGAAVRTINNILNGITNSVNRLSELHLQISDTPRTRRSSNTPHTATLPTISSKTIGVQKDFSPPAEGNSDASVGAESVKKVKATKRKSRDSRQTAGSKDLYFQTTKKPASCQGPKRPAKVDRRSKYSRTSLVERTSSVLQRKQIINSIKLPCPQPDKLVEIYHNVAARNSDSDETNFNKRKSKLRSVASTTTREPEVDIPPLNISENLREVHASCVERKASHTATVGTNVVVPQCLDFDQDDYEPPEAPRNDRCYYKSYELPTIASRMKQAAKSYMNTFNFKAIPFVTAISTTPSHNIGINIQQVLNIIKNRHPVNGISPTLAHNIGLAAEKLNSRPLSVLVSNINSRISYRGSRCPLSRNMINYNQLQDMAKSIPEESPEEAEAARQDDGGDSPVTHTIIVTGPSGDMEIRTRDVPKWAADPASAQEQCTCAPKSGMDFREVVNRYSRNCMVPSSTTVTRSASTWGKSNKVILPKKVQSLNPKKKEKNGYISTNTINTEAQVANDDMVENPLQGKERNLKEVLTNLHSDFEYLNKRYEDLSQKATSDDEETIKELEKLEVELNKKEEEITMVMTLYKEVLALKQQVKSLKQKTSLGSMTQESKEAASTFKDYNNPQMAFHLTKLLRQIHTYQKRYKQEAV
ncbi:unnamed protein product [Callosobruchus maculatus]|uniref:Uncharacterized protein n=1 Tax=Callosobruchus maculatus TaxID=64391 RepID=A0A653CWJ5_CALMS|nr:unnamed protein product [Callosobruchus maculatus]VEN51474.1 unnamed protein product [Callosobruchus maculatus]VEN51475.1 unnamed protein product [Callosobruchus maculatus]VEN51476.1 unnamed protein product [Callosobruchus maculatus]